MKSSHAEPLVAATPLWRRLLAALVDAGLAGGLAVLLVWVVVASDPSPPDIPDWALLDVVVDYAHLETARTLVGLAGAGLVVVLVLGLQLASFGVTLGLRLTRLSPVEAASGQPPRRSRLLAWLVLGLALGALAGASWWWGFVAPSRRTLHDRLTGLALTRAG
jgi:hypothetical protein